MAVMEVLHAMFGLVRSPVATTALQVFSRLNLIWTYTNAFEECQAHWSLYLMVGSWALVEVPRYLFYAFNLYMDNVPFPLFFVRYNAFMLLYPTGISGEMLQMYTALGPLATWWPLGYKLTLSLLVVYLPGGPFMIASMFGQRARASKKRAAALGSNNAKKAAPSGLLFPTSSKGDRSTTEAGRAIFADALKAVSADLAAAASRERNWRFGYPRHVIATVEAGFQSDDAALKIARAGLDSAMQRFEFVRDGTSMSLAQAMATIESTFHTGVVQGTQARTAPKLSVPYKKSSLSEQALLEQLNKWAQYGTIEPSCRDAIAAVVEHPEWMDLSDRYFVLLGAGSAMGPLETLLDLGANIIAVDLDRPNIWERLINRTRKSSGSITFPLKMPQKDCATDADLFAAAGCNLCTQTPEIKNWVASVHTDKHLTIGGYAYLDGALHVQLSLAMVAIMEGVSKAGRDVSMAFLCSPTDVFLQPEDAVAAVAANAKAAPAWQSAVKALCCGKALLPNTRRPANGFTAINGLIVPQGPNYALAKRLQHWLAMLARADGHIVSSNIAPSTATASVVHNSQFAAAFGGMHHFKPMEIFYQQTSNAVMCALLIHDLRNPDAASHPGTKLRNPLELFSKGAFHGGIWRGAYRFSSIGVVSASVFYLSHYALQAVVGLGGVAAYTMWLFNN